MSDAAKTSAPRTQRKVRTGVVTSDKMQQTVTVELTRQFAHPTYGKQMTRTTRIKARDTHGAKTGDTVRVMETRPLSKTVRWRVIDIVQRAK
ncbi:MAG TPA: 30S ribosomal protein S17 [Gemmatimonadales bacterium]|nr:30S ribosomal protein S17 [Gemmatimonadales bacterium]